MERIIPVQIEKDDEKENENKEQSKGSDLDLEKILESETNENKEDDFIMSSDDITEERGDSGVINFQNSSRIKRVGASLIDDAELPPEIGNSLNQELPLFNTKEKIIFVLDRAEDDQYTPFKLSNKDVSSPLTMLKQAIEMFVNCKTFIDNKHEYALVLLDENSCSWCHGFTKKTSEIINKLSDISPCEAEDIFSLNSLFELIMNKVSLPSGSDLLTPPPYTVRIVLLYNRSYTIPELKQNAKIQNFLLSPYITVDVLMTHEPLGTSSNCNKIFNILQRIDTKGMAYFFPVSRNLRLLYSSMGLLLSHPLQRPTKTNAEYNIKDISG